MTRGWPAGVKKKFGYNSWKEAYLENQNDNDIETEIFEYNKGDDDKFIGPQLPTEINKDSPEYLDALYPIPTLPLRFQKIKLDPVIINITKHNKVTAIEKANIKPVQMKQQSSDRLNP